MTIDIDTREQAGDSVPALHIHTLKDLSPRDDDAIRGGVAFPDHLAPAFRKPSHSGGYSCAIC